MQKFKVGEIRVKIIRTIKTNKQTNKHIYQIQKYFCLLKVIKIKKKRKKETLNKIRKMIKTMKLFVEDFCSRKN